MKKKICLACLPLLAALGLVFSIQAHAAEKQTIYNSPYVSFSPDGQAWTTDSGSGEHTWYPKGERVYTGISSSLRALKQGEHYYKEERPGEIPIGYWEVSWRAAQCIHSAYPPMGQSYHGLSFGRSICGGYYNSGWFAYCADCGEPVTDMYVYMSREAAESIDYFGQNTGSGKPYDYYYLCPHCKNLEQGAPLKIHKCKKISWNRYAVQYDENCSGMYGGYMYPSVHMYHNAKEYEGEQVTPATHLTKNSYTRKGYEFVGWNTKPDGSGENFEDGQEILNLTEENWENSGSTGKGIVTLYAQWRPSRSTLVLDGAGGTYGGKGKYSVTGAYGTAYTVDSSLVKPPVGYTVTFETNGGNRVPPITGSRKFTEWEQLQPFLGNFYQNQYTFTAPDGKTDILRARYDFLPIILPNTEKSGYSLGGWYYDKAFAFPAGKPGESFLPDKNLTLYAQWVELKLTSRENYTANGGRGAVDLTWTQPDGKNKVYRLYQSKDGQSWSEVYGAKDIGGNAEVREFFAYTGKSGVWRVPYAGFYTLTGDGAQGGGYGSFRGGCGGSASAKIWLQEGEVLSYEAGGQNGYNGGGRGSVYGNGGGSTIVTSDRKGLLLTAGGGGGAAPAGNGGAGGSSESLVSGAAGQNGMAGGGAGYRGGTAGEQLLHHHSTAACGYHTHAGDRVNGGACYQTQNTVYQDKICHVTWECVDSASWECNMWQPDGSLCHGTRTMYRYDIRHSLHPKDNYEKYQISVCSDCNIVSGSAKAPYDHVVSVPVTEYLLSCRLKEGWQCGMAENQVVSSRPAYGGSSYVNGNVSVSGSMQSGVRTGNGQLVIQSEDTGFLEALSLAGVDAPDLAPPKGIESLKKEAVSSGLVQVSWEEPEDRGTDYYHYVKSYMPASGSLLCSSNRVKDTLVSGVRGYYVLLNASPNTVVDAANGSFQTEAVRRAETAKGIKYLHVAAADVAGNIGETTHIALLEQTDWKLYTKKLQIAEGENVYGAGKDIYYVKSDGKTPFTLQADSFLDGTASEDYQVNLSVFESLRKTDGEEIAGRNLLRTPSHELQDGTIRTEADALSYSTEGEPALVRYPYAYTLRSSRNRDLSAVQKFTLDASMSGKEIEVFPHAAADRKGESLWSDRKRDRVNGIMLIADGEAPVIKGLEILEDKELINRPEGTVFLTISAEDALSGVKKLTAAVVNTDNHVKESYEADERGNIRIELTENKPVFSGDFFVTVHAEDNVGNVREETAGATEFALEAAVERILAPHEPIFQCGESGILTITTWGYAERVEVEFPKEFTKLSPEMNQVYTYTAEPGYQKEEKLSFMVPLYAPTNQSFDITVRAYKGDKKLEEHPVFSTIEVNGSVLEEFRTRLR